jgi:hypothetical protein
MRTQKRLLVMACSARKFQSPEMLPAIERYDGILFRVLKRWMHRNDSYPTWLDIVILSAEYGLISPEIPIPYYDRKMDRARAIELAPNVVAQLAQRTLAEPYKEVFLALGRLYRRAVEPIHTWLPSETRLIVPSGGIGAIASQLKKWLEHSNAWS